MNVVANDYVYKKALYRFVYKFNPWLRDYEYELLQAFLSRQTNDDRLRIISQLNLIDNVSRSNDGRIVQFYELCDQNRTNWGKDIFVPMHGKKEKKEKYEIEFKGKKVIANIFISLGALSAIEFKTVPESYINKYVRIDKWDRGTGTF